MSEVFLKIVNMSISASWLVLAILLLRLVLKKAPKWVSVLLWGLVALRLMMPFSIESNFSLIPDQLADGQMISGVGDVYIGETDTIEIFEGNGQSGQQSVGSFVSQESSIKPAKTVGNTVYPVLSWIWLAGVAALLIYTAISYLLLRKRVATAVLLRNNIYQSENVDSPFVLGIIKPKIYLPFRMDGQTLEYVIAHEESHIRRKDHWWKPFGFVLLALHWFNPLIWAGYILLCRDIELACDEKVIKAMDSENKAGYTEALVSCSVGRRSIAACPLAFGEVGVKERVQAVMNYKKPAFWIILAAVVSCFTVAVCFLTNPDTGISDPLSVYIDCQIAGHFQTDQSEGNACCVNWEVLGTRKRGSVTTVYMWVLYEEYSMNFDGLAQKEFVLNADTLHEETGSHIPTVITVKHEDGQYKLIEYWEPKDGSYYVPGIREKFPWYLQHKALDSQRYVQQQQDENLQMALDYFQSQLNNGGAERPEYAVITNNAGILSGGNAADILPSNDVMMVDSTNGAIIYGSGTNESRLLDDVLIILDNRGEIVHVGDKTDPTSLDEVVIVDRNTGDIIYGKNGNHQIIEAVTTELKPYFKLSNGTWLCNGQIYRHRHEISGRTSNNAAVESTFVYLSNLNPSAFAKVWKAAGYSSSQLENDFKPEETVLVEWITDANGSSSVDGSSHLITKPKSKLDAAISEAILSHHKNEKPDGLLNTASHIILANEAVSGTPPAGQTGQIWNEAYFVYYLYLRFNVQGDRPEEQEGIYQQAIITFDIEENGKYILKDFCEPEHSSDYNEALLQKFTLAVEEIAEHQEEYEKQLLDICWDTATGYVENQKAQSITSPDGHASGAADYIPYAQIMEDYHSFRSSIGTLTENEIFSAYADLFACMAHGSPSEAEKIAALLREIVNDDITFETREVFEIAQDYAIFFSKYASGNRDDGLQELRIKIASDTTAILDFMYWGEMRYSVKMVPVGEPWVTGEFTEPYQGELGQYLMAVTFHDAEPSMKFLKKYAANTNHKLNIYCQGNDHEMTMRIVYHADHGYHVYIGSDDPFHAEEQSAVRLRKLDGAVSVTLNFDL